MIITFVISQQKTIPAIRALVEALCSRYGTKIDQLYAFPTPEQLCQASLEDLLALKLGYRAKYIYRLCRDAVAGRLDLAHLSKLDYTAAWSILPAFTALARSSQLCLPFRFASH